MLEETGGSNSWHWSWLDLNSMVSHSLIVFRGFFWGVQAKKVFRPGSSCPTCMLYQGFGHPYLEAKRALAQKKGALSQDVCLTDSF